ncbi:MAG: hypothetical protein RL042_2461, partial [Nitrospirota bacterium]
FALIGNHPYRSGIDMRPYPFQALLGCDTKTTVAVVDQKTSLRRFIGWICHCPAPSWPSIHRINTLPNRRRRNSVYSQWPLEFSVSHWCQNSRRMLKRLPSKAAGESKPEAYPQGYVEDFDEPRTKLGGLFSILKPVAVRSRGQVSSPPCDTPGPLSACSWASASSGPRPPNSYRLRQRQAESDGGSI